MAKAQILSKEEQLPLIKNYYSALFVCFGEKGKFCSFAVRKKV